MSKDFKNFIIYQYSAETIFVRDGEGTDYVLEERWEKYIELRQTAPARIVPFATLGAMREALIGQGLSI